MRFVLVFGQLVFDVQDHRVVLWYSPRSASENHRIATRLARAANQKLC